jgi:two-component system response regulator RegA
MPLDAHHSELSGRIDALVVDADDEHAAGVCASIRSSAADRRLRTADRAIDALHWFELGFGVDFVFVDTALSDGGARSVIDAAFRLASSPIVIAMGGATDSTADVFQLAQAGVHAYLPKPLDPTQIEDVLASAGSGLTRMYGLLRPLVGRFGLKEIQAHVRRVLVDEALARTGGSRSSAARVLGVTRPAVQKFLRENGP